MIYKKKLKTIVLKIAEPNKPKEKVKSSQEIYNIAKSIYAKLDDDQEHFTVFFLNNNNNITGYKVLFSGGQTHSNIDIKVIFRNALIFGAVAIICVHNHPSNTINHSMADNDSYIAIRNSGKILGINVLDNLIITKDSYCSFADQGIT